jgi:DNA-binding MarR family transcriptional regulator
MDDEALALWRRLQLVHLQVTQQLHRGMLAEVGIGYQDYVVLTELVPAAQRVVALARRVGFEKSRLSHQLDRLERDGLVRRQQAKGDRRGAEVTITAAGRQLQRRATPGHIARVDALFDSHVTTTERRALDRATHRIRRRLEAAPMDQSNEERP